jgi:CO/xanthine dehydrogenase FAD-binding subunit
VHPFKYERPSSLAEALRLLEAQPGAVLLAGGTDLVVELRNRSRKPSLVVDLKRIRELAAGISVSDHGVSISATTVMSEIEAHAEIRQRFPALVEAAETVGSIQIRNRATLAGNICHASPAADTIPALLVYGALLNLIGWKGPRQVSLNDFLVGRGQVALEPGELVASIELPIDGDRDGAAFARVTRRRGVDLATINLCCRVDAGGRTRFAYGAVGPRAMLVEDQSGRLADPSTDPAASDPILSQLIAKTAAISDIRGSREYRRAMLVVMSRRVLRTALDRLRARAS